MIITASTLGTATISGTILLMFYPTPSLLQKLVQILLELSPFMLTLFFVVVVLGVFVQIKTMQSLVINRFTRMDGNAI